MPWVSRDIGWWFAESGGREVLMCVSNSQWDFVRPVGDFTHTGVRDRAIRDEAHIETGRGDDARCTDFLTVP